MKLSRKLLITLYLIFSTFLYANIEINPIKQQCISSLDKDYVVEELITSMEKAIPSRDYDLLKKIKWEYSVENTSFIAQAEYANGKHIIKLHKNIIKIFCGITTDMTQFVKMQSLSEAEKNIVGIKDNNDSNLLGFNFHKKINMPIQNFLLKSGWKECAKSKFSESECDVFTQEVIKNFIDREDYLQYKKMLKDGHQETLNLISSSIIFVLLHEFAHHTLGHTKNIKENTLSLENIKEKEYEADKYARLAMYRGENLENISIVFSFDLFSVLDFKPQSTITKMNYIDKLTHDSAECRGTLALIDSTQKHIMHNLFENIINVIANNDISKKKLINIQNKLLTDTINSLKYTKIYNNLENTKTCSFYKDFNETKELTHYSELIIMANNIMNLSYQKNYEKIIEVLKKNILKYNNLNDSIHFFLIKYSTYIVNSLYKNKEMKPKISSNTVDNFSLKLYKNLESLDIITTSRILNNLPIYILTTSDKTFNEKVILVEKYAKQAVKYNPNLSESYGFLAEVEIYKKNRSNALKYYLLAHKTSSIKSQKNMIQNFIVELQDTSKELRKNTVLKFLHDESIKKKNIKENNNSVQLFIPNETQNNFPKLVQLIIHSQSMDNNERNYWFDKIPIMKKSELAELLNILETEKKKLEEINLKYSMINYIFEKLEDKGSINDDVMNELLERITLIKNNKLTPSLYKKFIKKFELIKNRVQSKDKYYHLLTKFYLKTGEYNKALNRAKKSIKVNSKNDNIYYDMGEIYYFQKNYQKSLLYYNKAIALNPKNANYYYNMGQIYTERTKEYQKAIKVLNKSVELNPKNTNSISLLAYTYSQVKEYTKALSLCKKALHINPKNNYTYSVLSSIYISQKDYKNAMETYRKLFKINPDNVSIYTDFFELQLIQGLAFNKTMDKKYVSMYQMKKENFIHYEMLKILENISLKNKVNLKNWQEKYQDTKSNWNFDILDEWIKNIKDKELKIKLEEALKIFKRKEP